MICKYYVQPEDKGNKMILNFKKLTEDTEMAKYINIYNIHFYENNRKCINNKVHLNSSYLFGLFLLSQKTVFYMTT